MSGLGDIGERAREIENLVSNAEFDRALVRVIDFAKQFASDQSMRHEAILHSANYKETVRAKRRNTLSTEEFNQQRSQCLMAVLQLVDDIVDMAAGLEAA